MSLDTPSNVSRGAAPPPAPEHPTAEQLQGLGDLCFLAMREPRFAAYSVRGLRLILQPPVDLMQFHVFRSDGVPRAAVTWAHFSPEVEAKFVRGEVLAPRDWRSGHQLWIVNSFAPYGQGTAAHIARWLKENLSDTVQTMRFARLNDAGNFLRFVEMSRIEGKRWGTHLLNRSELEKGH